MNSEQEIKKKLQNYNGINILGRYTILNIHALKNGFEIHKAKIDKIERENRQIYNYSWRVQHPSFSNW